MKKKLLSKRWIQLCGVLLMVHLATVSYGDSSAIPGRGINTSMNSNEHFDEGNGNVKQQAIRVIGKVNSEDTPEGIPFVNILVKGTSTGTVTDIDGNYSIEVSSESVKLVFTSVGYVQQEITVGEKRVINVTMEPDVQALEEVVVVGFGEQRKKSVVSSVTSVNVESIKMPSSNFTNAIAGQVAGMIAFQQSGEPGLGTDNSTFFIRGLATFGSGKVNPLILIDGVESTSLDMARLQPDDISDFSVLKDAAASSIYGARGANGVVLINTKLGKQGKTKYSFRVENRVSSNTRNFQLSDNITYMELENEAILTRDAEALPRYSEFEIRNRKPGSKADPYLFPSNNWIDELIRDYTWNQGYNLNISGGTSKGRYYIAGTYNLDNGILKVDPINNFNNNIKLQNYSVRSNIDLELTPTTKLITRIYGQFDDYTGPIGGEVFNPDNGRSEYYSGGRWIFNHALSSNPVLFPAVYPREKRPYVDHPLFGSTVVESGASAGGGALYINPYAEMVKGYQTYKRSNLMPQIELRQELDFITQGLSFRGMTYLRRISFYQQDRSYDPFYYRPQINPLDGSYEIQVINDGGQNSIGTTGTEYLDYNLSGTELSSQFWLQTAFDYNRIFNDKHAVGGMVLGYLSHLEDAITGSLIQSLPRRNAGLSGRFTYGFKDTYLMEFNFGFNGSERFSQAHRFGFFPSGGLGYVISNESFFRPLKSVVSNMKIRATYGVVGNDQIGNRNDRFLYLSNVSLNNGAYGATFGEGDPSVYSRPGISISRYANEAITWEESRQLNIGVDLGLFDNTLNLIVDAFEQHRTNILQPVSNIDDASGLMAIPLSNYGEAKTRGIDMSLDGNYYLGRDINMTLRGTFTFATSEIIRIDEINFGENLSHRSRKGYSINQSWGLIAERLFYDDEEVANTPVNQFNDDQPIRAGDIKYRDITGDGVINSDDMVPIGHPTQPEIVYGFGASFLYKDFDINFYFQGVGRTSFFINPWASAPFVERNYPTVSEVSQNRVLQVIADDHWSEENPDAYAFWPRLSDEYINSNNQPSTWWLRNGSFLRLKRVDVGYNFGGEFLDRVGIRSARLYLSGINLFMFSKFKLWDVEMGGNGLGYPIQSVYTLGLSVDF